METFIEHYEKVCNDIRIISNSDTSRNLEKKYGVSRMVWCRIRKGIKPDIRTIKKILEENK